MWGDSMWCCACQKLVCHKRKCTADRHITRPSHMKCHAKQYWIVCGMNSRHHLVLLQQEFGETSNGAFWMNSSNSVNGPPTPPPRCPPPPRVPLALFQLDFGLELPRHLPFAGVKYGMVQYSRVQCATAWCSTTTKSQLAFSHY